MLNVIATEDYLAMENNVTMVSVKNDKTFYRRKVFIHLVEYFKIDTDIYCAGYEFS